MKVDVDKEALPTNAPVIGTLIFTAETLGGRVPILTISAAEIVADDLSIFDGNEDSRTAADIGDIAKLANHSSSYYLVCNRSVKLAKVGVSHTLSYEECFHKYSRIYGHLDDFHFIQVDNGACVSACYSRLSICAYAICMYLCMSCMSLSCLYQA